MFLPYNYKRPIGSIPMKKTSNAEKSRVFERLSAEDRPVNRTAHLVRTNNAVRLESKHVQERSRKTAHKRAASYLAVLNRLAGNS